MYDIRIRNSNRCTKVPPSYKAFVFIATSLDSLFYRVVIAEDEMHAYSYIRRWNIEQGLDLFWRLAETDSDFAIVGSSPDYSDILF